MLLSSVILISVALIPPSTLASPTPARPGDRVLTNGKPKPSDFISECSKACYGHWCKDKDGNGQKCKPICEFLCKDPGWPKKKDDDA